MRILFAIKSLNVRGGGAEKVLVDVANGLRQRGHSVKVLTFDLPGEAFYDLSPDIERLDLAFNPAGQSPPPLGLMQALPRMHAVIRDENPDVIVPFMHSTFLGLFPALIGLKNLSVIFSEHTDYAHYRNRPIQYFLVRAAMRLAFKTTIPSQAALSSYPARTTNSYEVVSNPIDIKYWRSYDVDVLDAPKIIISVGRLYAQKDHSVLLDAFFEVAEEFPDWRLRLVGDGPLRTQLEHQVDRLGLADRVDMPGFTRDIGTVYSSSRFLVVSSRYESFGMVAAEALAAGRPVLSFDNCTGITEIVQNGMNGVLVKGALDHDGRVAALADGLRRMMEDPVALQEMSKRSPASVARFSLEAVLDSWEDILHRAAAGL